MCVWGGGGGAGGGATKREWGTWIFTPVERVGGGGEVLSILGAQKGDGCKRFYPVLGEGFRRKTFRTSNYPIL